MRNPKSISETSVSTNEIQSRENIPAIETHYKGYCCRSRLEARWLVFFDVIGIRYEYEPEGFKLVTGQPYLPDIWLPEYRWWCEIKPTFWTTAEEDRAHGLARTLKQGVMLLDGPPGFKSYFGHFPSELADGSIQVEAVDYSLDVHRYQTAISKRFWSEPTLGNSQEESEQFFSERYTRAVYASRSQRFEKGAA